jgi:ATP-binding cassette, subfamily B (MDR/TAP), member 1
MEENLSSFLVTHRKSTCAALILRLYDPDHGSVCFDGHDIRSLNVSWLRSQIGFVQQEPVLFNMSIRDNIAYGVNARTTTQEEIEEAARKANVHDFIVSLPHVRLIPMPSLNSFYEI